MNPKLKPRNQYNKNMVLKVQLDFDPSLIILIFIMSRNLIFIYVFNLTFEKIADFYQQEVDNTLAIITQLFEPMLIIILGILIGSLVIAIYLPIFNLGHIL